MPTELLSTMPPEAWADFTRSLFTSGLTVALAASIFAYLIPALWRARRLRKAAERIEAWSSTKGETRGTPSPFPGERGQLVVAWQRFLRAWQQSSDGHRAGGVLPDDFLTPAVVLPAAGRGLPEALPGIFSGFGLLGTFIGIAFGLEGIDLSQGDTGELMSGVSQLMSGMSAAFMTSIYGILFSLIWLVLYRRVRGQVLFRLESLNAALVEAFPFEDAQGTLLRLARTSEEARGDIQKLGGDIAEALENAFAKTVTPVLEEFGERIAEREVSGIEQLVESFRESLSESFDKDLSRLSEALTSAADHQAAMSTQIGDLIGRVASASESQTALLERTVEVSVAFSDGLQSLESAQSAITSAAQAVGEAATGARELINESERHAESHRESALAVQEVLAAQLDTTRQHVEGVFEFWDDFEERIGRMREEIQGSMQELTLFTAEKIGEVFQSFDEEMATVVRHLSGTLSELRSATEDLPAAAHQIADSIERLPNSLSDASQSFSDVTAALNATTDRTVGDLESLAAKWRESTDEIGSQITQLRAQMPEVASTTSSLIKSFEKTDRHLENLRVQLEKNASKSGSPFSGFLGRS